MAFAISLEIALTTLTDMKHLGENSEDQVLETKSPSEITKIVLSLVWSVNLVPCLGLVFFPKKASKNNTFLDSVE